MHFRALHDAHDHRYVLTLPRNTDRHTHLRADLAGWELELVHGVDRETVSVAQLVADGTYDEAAARRMDRRNKPMLLGAICCALGHRRIYERFLASAHQRVLIFEDDVRVDPRLDAQVPAMVAAMPPDAELVYWGWTGDAARPWYGAVKQALYHLQHTLGVLRYDHTMIRRLYPQPVNRHFARAGKQFCTHAYTLTRSGAEKLIALQTPIVCNADNALMYAAMRGTLRAYIALPSIFGQDSLDITSGVPSLTGD